MKKFLCGLIAGVLMIESASIAFAASPNVEDVSNNSESAIVIDLSEVDLTKPYKVEKQFINEYGDEVTIGAVYTPQKNTEEKITPFSREWSHQYQATEGTWTSYYDGSILSQMQYTFDVSKSGDHWMISNGRDFYVSMLITNILNKNLRINRSISSFGMPAEITGSCTLRIGDSPLGTISTIDAWIKTTVSDDGVLTVSGN